MATYTDPFRLRVLKALTAALQQITPANGYVHDLSSSVFRGRTTFGDNDPLPVISILESPDEPVDASSPRGASEQDNSWVLFIQGFVEDDIDNPTDPAHVLMADAKRCLALIRRQGDSYGPGAGILGMGGLVDQLNFSGGVVRGPDEISGKAYFWVRLELVVVEDVANPYD